MVDVPPLQQELLAAQAALAAMPVPAQGADATEYMAAQDKVVRLWSAQAEVEKLAWMRSRTAPPDAGLLTGGTVRWRITNLFRSSFATAGANGRKQAGSSALENAGTAFYGPSGAPEPHQKPVGAQRRENYQLGPIWA
jgi:hypothetical protein